jgi:signal transduction histidine kinase/ligand-binding sensor domain-containing protein/CheY-like chemotaxis protein/AraC-like DNA-binding protein
MKLYLLALLMMFTAAGLQAQGVNYNVYNISTDNGLPTNHFQYVYQDSYGFLWLASYDGLFRWDGYTFRKYYHDEKDSLSLGHNIVYSIYEDSQRRLWIGTIEGLNLYDRLTDGFKKCVIGQPGVRIPVNAIREDARHQLWLGTSKGLCLYHPEQGTTKWYVGQNSEDIIFCLAIDRQDNVWAGTFNGGVKKLTQATQTFTTYHHTPHQSNTLASDKIKSILVDHRNHVWVGTADRGITVLDSSGHVVRHYNTMARVKDEPQNVASLYEDKHHNLWIGVGREALYYLPGGRGEPLPLGAAQGYGAYPFLSVVSTCEDSFGNIWFATAGNGLFYTNVNKNVFENYLQQPDALPGLGTTVMTCFYEDAAGTRWIGTDGGGLIRAGAQGFTRYTTRSHHLTSDAINDIKGDTDGTLWIATWNGGVMRFDPRNGRATNFLHDPANPNTLPINDAKVLLPDDTVVWIGTHGEGLAAYDRKHRRFLQVHKEPAWINHLYKDTKGRLWISTYSGLYLLEQNKLHHFEHSSDLHSISSNSVNMVTEDRRGNLWVISESGGLEKFDEATRGFTRLRERYNLPPNMKSIVADQHDVLWIGSNSGIIALDPAAGTVRRYDGSDGLQGNTFFHKAVLRSRGGQLLFGGPKGFNVFHPDSLKPLNIPSYFYATELYIYNKPQYPHRDNSPLTQVLPYTDKLVLTPEQAFFSVEVAAVNLYSPAKTQYAYLLDGLHDAWINLDTDRKISFNNLDPGSYTLRMRYTGTDGQWHDAPKTLAIVVLPPWWKTLWFKITLTLLLAGAVIAVFYVRLAVIKQRNRVLKAEVEKRTHELSEANTQILDQQQHITTQNHALEQTVDELQKLNKTKDHFFSILAHDLKNPVSALTGISDFMKTNFLKLERKEALEYLTSIHKSSNAIYDLLVNLLNWSRTQSRNIEYTPDEINLQELLQKNIALLEQQLTNKHLSLSLRTDRLHVAHGDYNMIDTVVRNIISNSIKFTEYNGTITITTAVADDTVEIRIADTGVGMTPDQLQKLFSLDKESISVGTAGEKGTGLGLVIAREFIEINKGLITVESDPGFGTSFYITLPRHSATTKPMRRVHRPTAPTKEKQTPDYWEALPTEKLLKVKGKKILIIDDNAELRTYLKLLLSGTFEIYEAVNGEEGRLRAMEVQPTAIVTDLIMPVMNGIELCREIKNTVATCHIPVIVLTSQWEEQSQLSGYGAGADIYLTKPVKKDLFLQIIFNLITNQEKLRQKIRETLLTDEPTGTAAELPPLNKLDEDFLKRLVSIIETEISNPNLDARLLSETIAMSRTVLYGKVKTLTGQSVHEFIKSIRLKRSIRLLLEGELNISQIALEVGFNSHSYFDKCFIKQYGVGPKEYITRRRKTV